MRTGTCKRHPGIGLHAKNEDCILHTSAEHEDSGLFVKRLEARPMSTWTEIEMIKYAAITGQLCHDCGEIDCICDTEAL